MTFPVDAARVGTDILSIQNKVCNLPSGITGAAGEYLVLYLRTASTDVHSTPTGWTALVLNSSADGSGDTDSIWYRKTDGTEGSTVTVNGTQVIKGSAICWLITGADVPLVSSTATGNDVSPNPPSFSPSGGSQDYLWLWVSGNEGEQTAPPAGTPSGYSNVVSGSTATAGAVTANCRTSGASKQATAATEDPPVWTISVADQWSAWTVAIPPAAATSIPPGLGPVTHMRTSQVEPSLLRY